MKSGMDTQAASISISPTKIYLILFSSFFFNFNRLDNFTNKVIILPMSTDNLYSLFPDGSKINSIERCVPPPKKRQKKSLSFFLKSVTFTLVSACRTNEPISNEYYQIIGWKKKIKQLLLWPMNLTFSQGRAWTCHKQLLDWFLNQKRLHHVLKTELIWHQQLSTLKSICGILVKTVIVTDPSVMFSKGWQSKCPFTKMSLLI